MCQGSENTTCHHHLFIEVALPFPHGLPFLLQILAGLLKPMALLLVLSLLCSSIWTPNLSEAVCLLFPGGQPGQLGKTVSK